jgi:CheY-like chemotaxis protein
MKRILVIDDDVELVNAMKTLLESNGYNVSTAHSGAKGYEVAKRESPSLIFLDVMMSTKVEGFEIARALNTDETTKDIPVVMITGIRNDMNLPFGVGPDKEWLPVEEVLEKPVKPEKLLSIVRNYAL